MIKDKTEDKRHMCERIDAWLAYMQEVTNRLQALYEKEADVTPADARKFF